MRNDHPNYHRHAGRNPEGATSSTGDAADNHEPEALVSPNITVFRCAHCSPQFQSESPLHEIALPCTGKLQPEHLLKAFESGADAVCVVTCAQGDCLYLEGTQRTERRVEYVKELLDEIGLGADRLTVFHLAASEEPSPRLAAIRETIMAGLGALPPNPLRRGNGAA
jgi:F420-non-reducing hydrogenase iron-sulfur subunit